MVNLFSRIRSKKYVLLVKKLEIRYGQRNLELVFDLSQLKNGHQRPKESLQEFENDIAQLTSLAYPCSPENVKEAFINFNLLTEALTSTLEIEAVKQDGRVQHGRVMEAQHPTEESI